MKTTNTETTIPTELSSLTGRYLGPEDINGIVKLQDIVSEDLKTKGTPRHIVKRSEDHFLKHLSEPHAMYGITNDKGEIIAQAIFRISDISTMEELCLDSLPGLKEGEKMSVAQGVLVHPDYEKQGLMSFMLQEWFKWCEEKGVHHLTARTESSHNASQKGFLKNGFNEVAKIIDPVDNAEVKVLHKITQTPLPEDLQGAEPIVIDLTCS